jgi:hypothetical protein
MCESGVSQQDSHCMLAIRLKGQAENNRSILNNQSVLKLFGLLSLIAALPTKRSI